MTNTSDDWRKKASEAVESGNPEMAYTYADWADTMDAVKQEEIQDAQTEEE